MTKDLYNSPPAVAPSQEKIEVLKDSLRDFIARELVSSGTFNQVKVEQNIIEAMPSIDKTMLGVRLLIFKADVEHFTESMKLVENKKELSSAVSKQVDLSLNFLLS